ncbi:MAG: hypothetical protein IRZ14_07630 [Chloroflexi bacterium]|nr:hypothetical protein [Chloroflexota bacterium]
MPDLDFRIAGAEVLEFAAAPTLLFKLAVANRTGEPVRAILLHVQVRIEPVLRDYAPAERERLLELFGDSARWGTTLHSLLWTQATVQVRPFQGETVVDLPLSCTYDFEVVSAKYFHALDDGAVPLVFLFSGTVFYLAEAGLQVVQIPWDREAAFRLPIGLWRQAMEHYFPNSAWLRLEREAFDRLYRYRARRALPSWEATLDELLRAAGEGRS